MSILRRMLGYMEQGNLSNSLVTSSNTRGAIPDNTINFDFQTPMPMFICPSTPNSNRVGHPVHSRRAGGRLFLPVHGRQSEILRGQRYDQTGRLQRRDWSMAASGTAILQGTVCPFRNITDGLTNTILFAECCGRPYCWVLGDRSRRPSSIRGRNRGTGCKPISPSARRRRRHRYIDRVRPHQQCVARPRRFGLEDRRHRSDRRSSRSSARASSTAATTAKFTASIPAPPAVAMCDGSVQFLNQYMDCAYSDEPR